MILKAADISSQDVMVDTAFSFGTSTADILKTHASTVRGLGLGVRFPVSAVWKKHKCFFPINVSVLWGASVTER